MDRPERIGIMGGTFNPIHLGHLIIAENAYEELGLDEVLFIPSGKSYMKDKTDVLDAGLRAALVREAIADNPHFSLSTLEAEREGNSYSCDTIEVLRKKHPVAEFYFLLGTDSLFTIEKWKRPERIFAETRVAAAFRQDSFAARGVEEQLRHLEKKYGSKIIRLPCRSVELSSTRIRERLRQGKSIRYMVHHLTEETILREGLYQR